MRVSVIDRGGSQLNVTEWIASPSDCRPVFLLVAEVTQRFKVCEVQTDGWLFDVSWCQLDLVVNLCCWFSTAFT